MTIKGFVVTVTNKNYTDQLAMGDEWSEFYRDYDVAISRTIELQCTNGGSDNVFGVKPATLIF